MDEVIVGLMCVRRIERGTHAPSDDTARALARWLGWTAEQVFEAAETPVAGDVDTP